MKRTILYTASAFFLLFGATEQTAAQNISYDGNITVEPVRLQQAGETLHVEMDILLQNLEMLPAGSLDLVPRLIAPADTLELPRLSFKGRSEYLQHERTTALMNKKDAENQPEFYRLERNTKADSRTIRYVRNLPFRAWMKEARLEVRFDEGGCGEWAWSSSNDIFDAVTLEALPVPYRVVPSLAYIQPVAEVKRREKQVETFLDFVVNQTDIRPDYMNNPQELAKIHTMIDELNADTDITINRLDIIGYASPEGSLANNKRLSEGRANALKNYLASKYSFPTALYHTVFGGENWDGLRKALPELHIDGKAEIERILDSYDGEERKNRLKNLAAGEPYRYLLRNVYPALRVAICKVEYSIKNFDLEEARQVFKVRPQNLSLNEMYAVANSYPAGSQEFIDVFETAVRMFPQDDVARLNAAASALTKNDIRTAERYLSQVSSRQLPEYRNAAGVLALLQGDYQAAENHLNAAAEAGLEQARRNLEELARKKENDLQIESKP